jgi:DNA invertase Pin-like site-specific DNA recombinase
MIAAIYARKSTEQTGIADEQKSVARQIEHAGQYAARQRWAVADEHVYATTASAAPNSRPVPVS